MIHANCVKTVIGGLSLLLAVTSCSSGAKTRKADSSARNSDVVTDRGTYDPMDRMTAQNQMPTERQVPHDRVGSGEREADRIVPCADDRGDMTASMDCGPANRTDYRGGLAAACPSRTDAQGKFVYDDPACPDRYYTDRAAYDRSTGAAACSSRVDKKGNVIYDDPACPARYRRPMGSSFENVRWTQESAFYDRYANKAAKHAREAEVAGNQGHTPEMLRHAELSLDQAKEAQRAGHQIDLDAGIVALREAITFGQGNQGPAATASIRDARVKLSRAAGIPVADNRVGAVPTSAARRTHIVRGELARNDRSTAGGVRGGEQYVVRDSQNREMPIALSPEMSQQVKEGDVVEAQIDQNGQVTSITKAQ